MGLKIVNNIIVINTKIETFKHLHIVHIIELQIIDISILKNGISIEII